MAKVLVIDDEDNIRKTLREILEDESHEVATAADGEAGLRVFADESPDVVLLDIQMPKRDGLEILKDIKALKQDAEVIMITGHGTIELAVQAVKAGAYHFLQKPLSLIEVKQNVRHAAEAKRQRDELKELRASQTARYRLVGQSRAMAELLKQIAKVAPTPGRVLIKGESGTGKELVAFAIHEQSLRAGAPFVKINCAAIPENLIESELFGHEKGAFTGAVGQKRGKFELANNGTLFLDEIGDMDLNTQTKVLRVIQEGELERVGGEKVIRVDVRVIAATHRDLEKLIAEGKFREDLFYRLNVLPLRVPPLSERQEDIAELAEYFLKLYAADNGAAAKHFSPDALSFLSQGRYPGNIRELRNVVERAAILSEESAIGAEFLQSLGAVKEGDAGGQALFRTPRPLGEAKDLLEKTYVETQLGLNGWNVAKTAQVLGIERTNLHRKMKQLGIEKV